MELCPESRRYIVGNIIFQWLEMFMNIIMIYAVAMVFEYCHLRSNDRRIIYTVITAIVITTAFRFLFSRLAIKMSHMASRTIMGKMRNLIYDKLLKFGSRYTEKISTAELVQESVEGVEQLESYFGNYVPQFFYAFLAPLTLFFLFGFLGSWPTAGVLLVCVPLIPGAIMMVQKFAKKILNKYWGQYTQLGSTFLENLQAMITLKTYQADEYKNEQMNAESENFRVITMKVLMMQLNSIIIMDFFTYGGAALGIILALRDFNNDLINMKTCVFMILLSVEFFLPMRRLGSYFHVAMNGMAASDKIFHFLSLEEPVPGMKKIGEIKNIRFSDVCFGYNENKEVLKNIDLDIDENMFIGIVGESGSGKSTIASLLMGRHVCQKGNISINDVDIREISNECLMEHITYVGFHSVFFKGSIRENLLMAKKNATEDELWKALDEVLIGDFFRSGAGLDTMLNENASNLSGGQKQRLALARAILHDSDVYIFDEAASNIDMESEEIINQSIRSFTKDKTVIMITHRLNNIIDADEIYVLKDGEVIGTGKHDQLLTDNETYRNLYETQKRLEEFGRDK